MRDTRGITLIALIITIIVLLILAGISIATLTESKMFEKTDMAKEEYKKSQVKEELQLEVNSKQVELIKENK